MTYTMSKIMNSKQIVKVTSMLSILALVIFSSVQFVNAQNNESFMPYGSIGQEDQLYVIHEGSIYVNTGDNLGIGNGQFMKIIDVDTDYSIDQAIERFNINEDVSSFVVEPTQYSDVGLVFQLDNDLQFQLVDAIEVE